MPATKAEHDAGRTVTIDRSDDIQRMRYRCPNGHTTWAPTNRHLWCKACRQANEHGEDLDPEHWHIVDAKTNEKIPWERVELTE